jgi:hypothetical protein
MERIKRGLELTLAHFPAMGAPPVTACTNSYFQKNIKGSCWNTAREHVVLIHYQMILMSETAEMHGRVLGLMPLGLVLAERQH